MIEPKGQNSQQFSEYLVEKRWEAEHAKHVFWDNVSKICQVLLFVVALAVVPYSIYMAAPQLATHDKSDAFGWVIYVIPHWWPILLPFMGILFASKKARKL